MVLVPPSISASNHSNQIKLTSISDEGIQKAIESASTTYGTIGSFVHLHPHFEFQNGNFAQHFKSERPLVKLAFLLAKHLQKSINDLAQKQRACFMTVSQMDGKLGLGKRGNVSIIAGGLPGMVKSLNLEWSPVFCKAIDVQPELSPIQKAKQILAEFHDADVKNIEVGFSDEGRKTIVAGTPKMEKEGHTIETSITSDSVFLVSGGAKGVTATCVIEMAKKFKCKFILLGRSSNEYEVPAFAKTELTDAELKRLIMEDFKNRGEKASLPVVKSTFSKIVSKKEIEATLSQIETFGGQAIYIQGDVTNAVDTSTKVKEVVKSFGEITGVIHGAGRLADKKIEDKSEQDFDNVLSVKLDGLLSLFHAVDIHGLKHLVLFSSVAGFYGNVGQTDYAIANEVLSKAAHLFKTNHPNTHVSAINWGAWDSGMVSDALKKQFKAAGVSLVNSIGGGTMMINEFNIEKSGQPQMIIGGTLPAAVSHISEDLKTYTIQRNLLGEDNPFLMHHVIQENAVLPVVNAVGWMAQSCSRLYPDFRVFEILNTRLFKGLVFDGNEKIDYQTIIKETEKSKERIEFDVTVQSKGPKLPMIHYKATVVLVHKNSVPQAPIFSHTIPTGSVAQAGENLYTDGSLFHGHFFQGIEQILECDDQQIILSCKAPEVPQYAQGQFPVEGVNTFFADIQYQGMVVWVSKNHDGAKSLPLQTDKATIYQAVPFEKELFVHVAILENTDTKMSATCTVYDENGKVYMVTENASVTISKTLQW